MSVRYICTQCEQFFIVGDGAGVAVNCLSCGGMAFPAAENDGPPAGEAPNPHEREGGVRPRDIHDEETDILLSSEDPYREPTEVLPARNVLPDSNEDGDAFDSSTSSDVHAESAFDDFSSSPSEESEPYSHPHPNELSAPNLSGPALPSSLWGNEDNPTGGERASAGSQENHGFDESELFESGEFELEAMNALDNAFGPDESAAHERAAAGDDGHFEAPKERTDPSIRPYALRRDESSDLHLTLSEEAQAIAGISLDSSSENAGAALADDETERVPRARKTVEAMPAANDAQWPHHQGEAHLGTQPPSSHPADEAPELASPDYRLPPRARLLAIAAACLIFGVGLGYAQTEGPVDTRSPLIRDAESRLVEGNRAFAEGELERALGHYRSALALQPNYPEAVYARAVVLARQKRFEEAARAYQEYVQLAPEGLYANAVRKVLRVYKAEK